MWNKNVLTVSLITLILSASPAQAEEFDSNKIRLGAGVGFADANTSTPTMGKFSAIQPTYMLNVGYALTPELELGLIYFNSTKSNVSNGVNTIHTKIPASTKAYLRKRWSYTDTIGTYGLMAIGPVEHRLTNPGGGTTYLDSFIGLALGAGISWQVDPQYIVDAGVMVPNIPLLNKGRGMNTFSPGVMVSLNYAFGEHDKPGTHHTASEAVEEPAHQTASITEPVVEVVRKEELLDTLSFRSGRVALNKKSQRLIKSLAKKVMANRESYSIEIRGYADGEPIGGFAGKKHKPVHTFQSQNGLSAARAESVANIFIKQGVDENIIQAVGFGATNFIADNKTRAGRYKNRRVEIYLITEESVATGSN